MALQPEISVCLFSYNFGKYIEQAIKSVLDQKLNVPFEIVIGDDKSTDGSQQIISKYHDLYPDLIRPIYNEENIGGTRNWLQTINACKGRYIAFLDGDDYFIDEMKLQKQFDILEKNQDCVLCFHGVKEVYEDRKMGEDKDVKFEKNRFDTAEILERGWFIRTGTIFFRNHFLPSPIPAWVYDYPYRLDSILPVFLSLMGNAYYLDDICSVWRKHSDGMSYKIMKDQVSDAYARINLVNELNDFAGKKYSSQIRSNKRFLYTQLFFSIIKSNSPWKYPKLFIESLINMDYFKAFHTIKQKFVGVKET